MAKLFGHSSVTQRAAWSVALILCVTVLPFVCSCSSGSSGGTGGSASSEAFSTPTVTDQVFDESSAQSGHDCSIDTSHVADGYVLIKANSSSKLKVQILNGTNSYNYDLPNDGTVTSYTLNMGDGSYKFRVMQNTDGSNYIELFSVSADVTLSSEFAPFLCSGYYCSYSSSSAAVAQARKLTKSATTQVEAVDAIYQWIISNITYDKEKAAELKNISGYVPDPDETLSSKTGICLDYAGLMCAMLRSIGVPTKIVTGYVSPDNIYHAWNLVYVNGEWTTKAFTISANEWSRVDSTFDASSESVSTAENIEYTDKFIY